MSSLTVRAPDGAEWKLERRLLRGNVRRPQWPGRGKVGPGALNAIWPPLPDDADLFGWLTIIVAVLAIAIVVIPLLLFGVELLVFGVVASATLIGSLVVAPRWEVRATEVATGRTYGREIAGRKASARTLESLVELIRAGSDPLPTPTAPSHSESVPPPR
jgi:hypothetical protein